MRYAVSRFESVPHARPDDDDSDDGDGAVHLLHGMPGPACGHRAQASSYFDRLWIEGNKDGRYFFCARERGGADH